MTTLHEAARMALEALTNCTSEHGHRCNRCDSEVDEGGRVADALRAALAASESQGEPVGVDTSVAKELARALYRIEKAVDWHLGRSAFTQTPHLKGLQHSENVRKELYAAGDEARAALSKVMRGGMLHFPPACAAASEAQAEPVADFRPGWVWMTNPTRNNGEPMPVLLTEDADGKWYEPMEPQGRGGQFQWERRSRDWQFTHPAAPQQPAPAERGEQTAQGVADEERERAYNAGFVAASRMHGAEIERLRALASAPRVPQWVRFPDGGVPAVGTECVVLVRYSEDKPPFLQIDKWDVQREDPLGMGGPTVEVGEGWDDNFDSDVLAWLAIPPAPQPEAGA